MAKLLDSIRKAIETSGQTRYQIAQGSGVNQSQLSRLVNGQNGLSIESVERIAEYLKLEVVVQPQTKRKAK